MVPCNLLSCMPTRTGVTHAHAKAAQVSISGQALVFVVRTEGYSLFSRAGLWTYIAFAIAQACPALAAPPSGSNGFRAGTSLMTS